MTVKWRLPVAPTISSYPAGVFTTKARAGLVGVEEPKAKSRLAQTAVANPITGESILYQAQPTVLPLVEPIKNYLPAVERIQDTIVTPVLNQTVSSNQLAQAAMAKAIAKRKLENPDIFASKKQPSVWKAALRNTFLGVMIMSFILMAGMVVPELYYRAFPENVAEVATMSPTQLAELHSPMAQVVQEEPVAEVVPVANPLPAFDPTLPEGTWILIPSIGVETQLQATLDSNEALNQGAWLVPDFGRPDDSSIPMIAAAHRFGWDWWWQSDFGRKNSFYSLPNLKQGDTVEVIYGQRKYVYRIYSEVIEGTEITDYQADLILYTCKFLNSPERFFVYANRDTTAEISDATNALSGLVTH